MVSRAGALVVAMLLALPAIAEGAPPDLRPYRVGQPLTLTPGQAGTWTLACRDGDLATDGSWRAENVDVDVLEADTFSRSAYRFRLRSNAQADTRVRLAVSCLRSRAGRDRLRGAGRRERAATLPAGPGSIPAIRCPRGSLAVAPGFRVDSPAGVARVTARYPTADLAGSSVRLTALSPVAVTASTRCLRSARHLRVALRAGNTDVADGRAETFTVRCHARETAIAGAFRLSGSWYLGQLPQGRRRSFGVESPATGRAGDARLGLLCLQVPTAEAR
jgi:hypothetical protein